MASLPLFAKTPRQARSHDFGQRYNPFDGMRLHKISTFLLGNLASCYMGMLSLRMRYWWRLWNRPLTSCDCRRLSFEKRLEHGPRRNLQHLGYMKKYKIIKIIEGYVYRVGAKDSLTGEGRGAWRGRAAAHFFPPPPQAPHQIVGHSQTGVKLGIITYEI